MTSSTKRKYITCCTAIRAPIYLSSGYWRYAQKRWWSLNMWFLSYASGQTGRQTDTLIAILGPPTRGNYWQRLFLSQKLYLVPHLVITDSMLEAQRQFTFVKLGPTFNIWHFTPKISIRIDGEHKYDEKSRQRHKSPADCIRLAYIRVHLQIQIQNQFVTRRLVQAKQGIALT